jgi:carboxypeptidase C (cathepsin A)
LDWQLCYQNKWASPKYLIGESYRTISGFALNFKKNSDVSMVILVSPQLGINSWVAADGALKTILLLQLGTVKCCQLTQAKI